MVILQSFPDKQFGYFHNPVIQIIVKDNNFLPHAIQGMHQTERIRMHGMAKLSIQQAVHPFKRSIHLLPVLFFPGMQKIYHPPLLHIMIQKIISHIILSAAMGTGKQGKRVFQELFFQLRIQHIIDAVPQSKRCRFSTHRTSKLYGSFL